MGSCSFSLKFEVIVVILGSTSISISLQLTVNRVSGGGGGGGGKGGGGIVVDRTNTQPAILLSSFTIGIRLLAVECCFNIVDEGEGKINLSATHCCHDTSIMMNIHVIDLVVLLQEPFMGRPEVVRNMNHYRLTYIQYVCTCTCMYVHIHYTDS